MKRYVALCNDEEIALIYYYDLDEQCIYLRDDSVDKIERSRASVKGAKWGGILSIFLYPILGMFGSKLALIPMLVCFVLVSLFGGVFAGLYNVKKMETYLLTLEKMYLKENEVKVLYQRGRKTRLKIIACELCFLFIAILAVFYVWISKNSLVLIGGMVFLSLFWMLIISSRPICTLKWKQQMRKK